MPTVSATATPEPTIYDHRETNCIDAELATDAVPRLSEERGSAVSRAWDIQHTGFASGTGTRLGRPVGVRGTGSFRHGRCLQLAL